MPREGLPMPYYEMGLKVNLAISTWGESQRPLYVSVGIKMDVMWETSWYMGCEWNLTKWYGRLVKSVISWEADKTYFPVLPYSILHMYLRSNCSASLVAYSAPPSLDDILGLDFGKLKDRTSDPIIRWYCPKGWYWFAVCLTCYNTPNYWISVARPSRSCNVAQPQKKLYDEMSINFCRWITR